MKSGALRSFDKINMIYKDKGKEKLFKVSSIDNVDSNIAGDFLQNVASNLVDENHQYAYFSSKV